jgi:hypothetical protein
LGNWSLVAQRSSRSKIKNNLGGFVMPLRNESARAQARLQLETPISDDASLHKLQEQVAEYVREAKHRDPSEPNELISTVLDEVARDYFRHAIRNNGRPVT